MAGGCSTQPVESGETMQPLAAGRARAASGTETLRIACQHWRRRSLRQCRPRHRKVRPDANGPARGDVYLDGARMGRWISIDWREAARPQSGGVAFDPAIPGEARTDREGTVAGHLLLGPVLFRDYELPERINDWGGDQRLIASHARRWSGG
jgi:hypothetical protein